MEIYSYHSFLFPFLWDNRGCVKQEVFCNKLESTNRWQKDDLLDEFWNLKIQDKMKETGEGKQEENQKEYYEITARQHYQKLQYFNNAARRALFLENGEISQSYSLKGVRENYHTPEKQAKYVISFIEIEEKENSKTAIPRTIELLINNIRLIVFNTGVAVMVYETEYQKPDGVSEEQARKNVKFINEYGRRVYPPYLPVKGASITESAGGMLCAESIKIEFPFENGEAREIKDDFRDRINNDKENYYLDQPIRLPKIMTGILEVESFSFVTNRREADSVSKFFLEPAIDDRMFVCCCVADAEYAESFLGHSAWPEKMYSEQRQSAKWKFLTDWDTGKELYAVTNIDPNSSSCQNRVMMDQYFQEQLYLRWIEYGTIYSVTNHSMVCLTSLDVKDTVIASFLLLYVEMCILVLAQRASLIALDARITETLDPGTNEEVNMKRLIQLEKSFARFQGEILLSEVTPQIQGIELYEKLQEMLFVHKLEQGVQQQLNNLYEIAKTELDEKEQKSQKAMELILAIVAALSVFSAGNDFLDFIGKKPKIGISLMESFWSPTITIAILILICIIGYVIYNKVKGGKK